MGAIAAIDLARDYTVGAYRDHGYALACGMDPRGLMAELFGKATGGSKGKGGSMHFFDAGRHMFGGNGIVGAQIPVATGVALKCRYRKDGGRGAVLVRRRRHPPGLLPREPQHGKDLEPSHHLHLREQPVRHGDRLPARLLGHGLRCHGTLLRHPGKAGERDGRRWKCTGRSRRPRRGCEPSPRPCSWRSRPTGTAAIP